ncbi:MAG: amino acid ABC transporter substrate-binding protein [Eubacteriaceae bacterium]|nr:amino acid ABC transporter substrate-binding protein [Eubacteriaceae bacterium]
MKMRKRIIIAVTAAVMLITALGMTGCGGSDSDWSYIEKNGKLVVGLDDTFAPMGFRDKNDKLVGFDIDLARAVGKELDIKIEFKPIDWDAKQTELDSKNIDCIWNGMSATEERQKEMSLSKKYLNNKIIIMSLDKNVNVKSEADLKNLKIGTQADSAALETMKANKKYDTFKDKISEYKSYDDAILDMKAGRTDCIVIDQVLGEYKNSKMDENLYDSDFNFGDDYYAIGFRKDDTELTNKVNDAIQATIDSGEAAKISKKWFGKDIVILEDYK